MKNLMNLAVAVAILAVPSMGFAQNIENAANFSQSAVSADSLETSRDHAMKALENMKMESSIPVSAGPVMSASRVNLTASPVTAHMKAQDKYDLSDYTNDSEGYEKETGFFKTMEKALIAPIATPIEIGALSAWGGGTATTMYVKMETGSSLLGIMTGLPAGIICGAAGLALGAVVGVLGLVLGVGRAVIKLAKGKL